MQRKLGAEHLSIVEVSKTMVRSNVYIINELDFFSRNIRRLG